MDKMNKVSFKESIINGIPRELPPKKEWSLSSNRAPKKKGYTEFRGEKISDS